MTAKRTPGWWYPYIFVAMFGAVIVVNGVLVYQAINSFSGLDTQGAYEKGLSFDRTLEEAEAQARLGWKVAVTATASRPSAPGASAERAAQVTLSAHDAAGQAIDGLTVTAEVRRPTDARHDRTLALTGRGAGRYTADVVLPLPGQWDIHAEAKRGDTTYRLRSRVILP